MNEELYTNIIYMLEQIKNNKIYTYNRCINYNKFYLLSNILSILITIVILCNIHIVSIIYSIYYPCSCIKENLENESYVNILTFLPFSNFSK